MVCASLARVSVAEQTVQTSGASGTSAFCSGRPGIIIDAGAEHEHPPSTTSTVSANIESRYSQYNGQETLQKPHRLNHLLHEHLPQRPPRPPQTNSLRPRLHPLALLGRHARLPASQSKPQPRFRQRPFRRVLLILPRSPLRPIPPPRTEYQDRHCVTDAGS